MREMTASTSWCMRQPPSISKMRWMRSRRSPQRVALLGGQAAGDMVVLGQQLRPRAQSPGDLVEDRAAESLGHLLREHCGDKPLLPRRGEREEESDGEIVHLRRPARRRPS